MTTQRLQVNAPSVVAELVEGEVIAINLATGSYYSMQGWSAWAWSALAAGIPVEQVGSQLPDPDALAPFVQTLTTDRLLVPSDSEPKADTTAPNAPSAPFDGLVVEQHTDMADLILLDPVHDVDPKAGWPTLATDLGD